MSDVDLLKQKLAEWKHRLTNPDRHSIGTQIAGLLWRSAFYRSVNESRRFLPGPARQKEANGALHELIDDGYFIAGSIAVRRLLDKGAATGPRGVYSLRGLIKDIADNVKLLTRENVITARSLEYDFEPLKGRAREAARREADSRGEQVYFVSRDGWADSEHWHAAMDRLCGVKPDHRSRSDAPDQNKLNSLLIELDVHGGEVQDWVDKFVAHASSVESRLTLPSNRQSVSLAKLWRAERVVVRAANFISINFVDGTNFGGVPIPQFDQFEYIDRPFAQAAAIPAMRSAWERHHGEISACLDWEWDKPLLDGSDTWVDENDQGTTGE